MDTSPENKGTLLRKWLLRLVGVLLLGFIVFKVGRDALLSELASADWMLVGMAAVLCALHFAVKALRWRYILAKMEVVAPAGRCVEAYCSGALLGIITPGRVGELAKAVFVRNWSRHTSWGVALGSVVLDRIVDVASFAAFSLLGFVWISFPSTWRLTGQFGALALLIAGAFASTYMWAFLSHSALGEKLKRTVRAKFGVGGSDFFETLKMAVGKPMIPLVLWTGLAYALFFASFVMLARALGLQLPAVVACWGISLASLGAILPISISGIGVRDFILIGVYSGWNEPAARVLALSLTYLGVLYVVIALMGVWPFIKGTIDLRSIYRARDDAGGEDA
jgi:uncharacterized protein (TIRG00374 family)